ncbi:MAG: LacI family DNA-binding transcriptional regulator [Chloroflexota bacterium]
MSGADSFPRVTITQVASAAGVSLGTVSNVLNGKGNVHPVLRERVLATAADLGYHPDALAQAFRKGRTRTIGFCVTYISNPTITAVLQSAGRATHAMGYTLAICATEYDPALERAHLEALVDQRVAAIIVYPANNDPNPFLEVQRAGVPIVFADHLPPGIVADTALLDHKGGTAAALRHLFERGRRRVALLTTSPIGANAGRIAGYRAAHAEVGMPVDERLLVSGLCSEEEAYRAMGGLLGAAERPDAVIAGNGMLVHGSLGCLRDRGVGIPDDVAFVGTGDVRWSRLAQPPLTMIEVDGDALGRQLVQMAMERLDGEPQPSPGRRICLPVNLVKRGSS